MINSKKQDLVRVICRIENKTPDQALEKLESEAFETANSIYDNSNILDLYIEYDKEIKMNISDSEYEKIIFDKFLNIISSLSGFYRRKRNVVAPLFMNSKIFKMLLDRKTNYWLKPNGIIINEFLKEQKEYICEEPNDSIFFADDIFEETKLVRQKVKAN